MIIRKCQNVCLSNRTKTNFCKCVHGEMRFFFRLKLKIAVFPRVIVFGKSLECEWKVKVGNASRWNCIVFLACISDFQHIFDCEIKSFCSLLRTRFSAKFGEFAISTWNNVVTFHRNDVIYLFSVLLELFMFFTHICLIKIISVHETRLNV